MVVGQIVHGVAPVSADAAALVPVGEGFAFDEAEGFLQGQAQVQVPVFNDGQLGVVPADGTDVRAAVKAADGYGFVDDQQFKQRQVVDFRRDGLTTAFAPAAVSVGFFMQDFGAHRDGSRFGMRLQPGGGACEEGGMPGVIVVVQGEVFAVARV